MTLLNTADFYTGFEPGEEASGNLKLIGEYSSSNPERVSIPRNRHLVLAKYCQMMLRTLQNVTG